MKELVVLFLTVVIIIACVAGAVLFAINGYPWLALCVLVIPMTMRVHIDYDDKKDPFKDSKIHDENFKTLRIHEPPRSDKWRMN